VVSKAYKFRIVPTKEQEVLINRTFGSCRYVFNHFLDMWNNEYKATGKGLSYKSCSAELPGMKVELPWLKEVDSIALQTSVRHLSDSFNRFFKKQSNPPRFKSRKNPVQSYTTKYTNGNISIIGKKVKLPKLGLVKIRLSRKVGGRIINATISRNSCGKYYISILSEEEIKPLAKSNSSVGIDLGLKEYATLSDGEKHPALKSYSKLQSRLATQQRSLSRKVKGSVNYGKQRLKVAKIHEKIKKKRTDYLHKLSTDIIKSHDTICIEELSVKDMMQDSQLSKTIADASWSKFVSYLSYKGEWYGKEIVKIGKYFPSSQLCSSCAHRNAKLKDLSVRSWKCPQCGAFHDRDINASINILNEGVRLQTAGTAGIA